MMNATALGVLLVCVCVLIEGFAQVALKISAEKPARRILWAAAGVALFLASAVAYTGALRFLNVSVAYAIESLGFVSVTLLSNWLLREHVTLVRWLGVALIFAGTGMVVAQA